VSTMSEGDRTAPGFSRAAVKGERNASAGAAPRPATMIDILLRRAAEEGTRPVYTYLANGEEESSTHTFADLDRQARAVAVLLRDNDCQPGDRALLLYPPGEREFIIAFVGCLYAGVVAVPVPPPHPARIRQRQESAASSETSPPTRLRRTLAKVLAIVSDSRPAVALTTERLRAAFEGVAAELAEMRAMRWLATDGIGDGRADEWERPRLDASALAFLQYTSGSTAAPKGVMVSHGNLLANARVTERALGNTARDVLVSWLPTFHDLGLIYGILQPLYTGFRCYLMPPAAFIQRPVRWLRAMSRYGGTVGAAPNFAYDLCVRKTTPEDRAALDLSRWRVAINGAEPVRAETLDAFAETFAACGFRRSSHYPSYGLAEATLYASSPQAGAGGGYLSCEVSASALEQHRVVTKAVGGGEDARDARTLVSCGHPTSEVGVRIVNPETCAPCAPDEVGEIWISGPNVAAGYWRLPEVSERTFRARLSNGEPGSYLRTGDLGFIVRGQLVVTGRHKDLIIVGGANFYPQDIELTAEMSHPDLRPGCSAAFSVDEGGEERVVVAVEVGRRKGAGELPSGGSVEAGRGAAAGYALAVRRAVAEEHEIQVSRVVLLKAGSITKTSSGKIQRQACRRLFLEGGLELWGA
jgi:acyl-CoA synthetase (AMP-forming)/AMP-acid ligase II